MRKLIASEWMSLDGVVQAPAYPDEDVSGGFKHGGWHVRYFEDRSMQWVVDSVTQAGGYLLGRGTYERFAAHWPNASEQEQVLARPLNTLPKYVASTTLEGPLAWQGSTLLGNDVAEAVAALKRQDGKYLLAIGSPGLVQSLLSHDLIDEVRVMIDPVVLGGGKRLFRDDGLLKPLRLTSSEVTPTGAILASYTGGHLPMRGSIHGMSLGSDPSSLPDAGGLCRGAAVGRRAAPRYAARMMRKPSTSCTTGSFAQRSKSWRMTRRDMSPPISVLMRSMVLICSQVLPTPAPSGM